MWALGDVVHETGTQMLGVLVALPDDGDGYRLRPPGGGREWMAPADGSTLERSGEPGMLPESAILADDALADLLGRVRPGLLLDVDVAEELREQLVGRLMVMLPVVHVYVETLPRSTTAYLQAASMLRVAQRLVHAGPDGPGTVLLTRYVRELGNTVRQFAIYLSSLCLAA